jgi:ribosomal 50S subunit-recycling heat shock protein
VRLDKYLKTARIIKRRTVAQSFAEHGRVEVNGRLAKPSTAVKAGDRIQITSSGQATVYEVLSVEEKVRTESASTLYRVLSPPDR